jgi:hypothetical protein
MSTSPIQAWADTVADLFDQLQSVRWRMGELKEVPKGDLPADERLAVLLSLRDRLKMGTPNSTAKAAEELGLQVAHALAGDEAFLARALATVAWNLDVSIAAALDEGGKNDGVIRTMDFGRHYYVPFPTADLSTRPYCCGVIASLPGDHELRRCLPAGGFYRAPGDVGDVLVLGRAQNQAEAIDWEIQVAQPRAWYAKAEALRLTALLRSRQLAEAEAIRREEERQRAERELAWNESPAGKAAALRSQLARLEAAQTP